MKKRRRGERGGRLVWQKLANKEGWRQDPGCKQILSECQRSIPGICPSDFQINSAGEAVVLHKDAPKAERWETLKQTNPILRSFGELQHKFQESENPFVASLRSVTSTIGSWFDENETAQVTRQMRYMDPSFDMESFSRDLREYIVPELVDAYLSADREALQMWCSEAVSGLHMG